MRLASVIFVSLLIHLGLLGRVLGDGLCCPETPQELAHSHDCGNADAHHSHGDCENDHDPSDEGKCPPDCGEHHHHHGACFHSMQLSLIAEGLCRLNPPHAVSLECEWHHLRAPDGPVMEMDKPPLIRASA